jgi:branched-chain amino acid transport system substrate-binding protein
MEQLWSQVRQLRGRPGAVAALATGVAVVWLVLAAIVGAIVVSDDRDLDVAAGDEDISFLDRSGTEPDDPSAPATEPIDPALDADGDGIPDAEADPAAPAPEGEAQPGDPGDPAAPPPGEGGQPPPGQAPGQPGLPPGGDATGVTADQIKIGVHAPITFSGVPLNLAEDPIKGLETYTEFLNQNGGINGRKIVLDIQDDRFDSEGARRAANSLINDNKNFMVSGTLGIDQIAIVANEAAKRGVPYTAAGGNEARPIPGMFQVAANYTTHVHQLADYMAADPKYAGKRVGILVSDSEFIRPVADQFKGRLEAKGMPVSVIVANQKPAQNPDYNGYILQFTRTNTEVVVPLTDPLTTQQIVQRCAAGAACGWTYSFSNFAHDSDTALTLMAPTWANQKVRGLSGSCYYLAAQVDDRAKCANMATARDQYVAARGQAAWEEDGSGAAAGYQIVGLLKGALTAPGGELTRERFSAALRTYRGYDDLISGPITFADSPNTMVGATKMAVLEAQSNNKFKMISDGLLGGF